MVERVRPDTTEQACQTSELAIATDLEIRAQEIRLSLHPLHTIGKIPLNILKVLFLPYESFNCDQVTNYNTGRTRASYEGRVISAEADVLAIEGDAASKVSEKKRKREEAEEKRAQINREKEEKKLRKIEETRLKAAKRQEAAKIAAENKILIAERKKRDKEAAKILRDIAKTKVNLKKPENSHSFNQAFASFCFNSEP